MAKSFYESNNNLSDFCIRINSQCIKNILKTYSFTNMWLICGFTCHWWHLHSGPWLQTQIKKQGVNQTFKIPQKPFLDLSQLCKKTYLHPQSKFNILAGNSVKKLCAFLSFV